MTMDKKTIVVVGAGQGMGNHVAKRFGKEGFRVVLEVYYLIFFHFLLFLLACGTLPTLAVPFPPDTGAIAPSL